MTLHRFLNALRILHSIDRHELVAAGVIAADDMGAWNKFAENPYVWMIKAGDAAAEALWKIVEARQSKSATGPHE